MVNQKKLDKAFSESQILLSNEFLKVAGRFKTGFGRVKPEIASLVSHLIDILFSNRLILFLIAISVLEVFLMAFWHIPDYEYDETHVLMIASQSFPQIREILSYEENFPFYHQIVRVFYLIFGQDFSRVGVFFNFFLWFLSIFIFYRIICLLIDDRQWLRLSALLAYIWAGNLTYYAYRLGPYSLFNFLFLNFLLLFLKYCVKGNLGHLLMAGVCLLVVSLVHPSALVLVLIIFPLAIMVVNRRQELVAFLALILIALGRLVWEFSQKKDIINNYWTQGFEYIRNSKNIFYESAGIHVFFEAREFFSEPEIFSTLLFAFYLLAVFLSTVFWIKGEIITKKKFIIFVFNVVFYLLPFLLGSFKGRHFIFLIPPFLIGLFIGLSLLGSVGKRVLCLTLLMFFGFFSHQALMTSVHKKVTYQVRCHTLLQLDKGLVVTNFVEYNRLVFCRDWSGFKTIFLNTSGLTNVTGYSLFDLAIVQAASGGQDIFMPSYAGTLAKLWNDQSKKTMMEEKIMNAAGDQARIYLIYNRPGGAIFESELKLIPNNCRFKSLEDNYVLSFSCE